MVLTALICWFFKGGTLSVRFHCQEPCILTTSMVIVLMVMEEHSQLVFSSVLRFPQPYLSQGNSLHLPEDVLMGL